MSRESNLGPPLRVKRIGTAGALPTRGSEYAAGVDLYASETVEIPTQERRTVCTAIQVAIPHGHYGRIAPRSGLAVKHQIDVCAGVVDADYRGEVKVVLANFGFEPYTVKRLDRIAQLILERISLPVIVEVDELDETKRGDGGFGSTDVGAADAAQSPR
tara:strand:- start:313 stop:789 length:477 start_codon:yes stop_codon:yes gene_type:complete